MDICVAYPVGPVQLLVPEAQAVFERRVCSSPVGVGRDDGGSYRLGDVVPPEYGANNADPVVCPVPVVEESWDGYFTSGRPDKLIHVEISHPYRFTKQLVACIVEHDSLARSL